MQNHELLSTPDQQIYLHQLLGNILPGFQQVAQKHKSFFVNEVPEDILISADKNVVASVLGNLLKIVSRNADNSCIRVSAKAYNNVVLMHVKDNNTSNNYALNSSLSQVQPLVGKIGGFIDINTQRQKATTIAFSFSNLPRQVA
ncbi:MAG: hypothetical protein JWM28_2541 [Chitinophagaceae bacterium]|nr:hypothetical protein [Chitinophagaceae bacterium]